jgi:uncharacterized membrane protein
MTTAKQAGTKDDRTLASRIARPFLRGFVTLAPVVLTLVIFGLLFQMVETYVTGPINGAIYWSLEGNSLGWKALERLGIDPYSQAYLDTAQLPPDLQDVANTVGGYGDSRFLDALATYREDNEGFFRSLHDLCVQPDRLRRDVKSVVHPLVGVLLSLLLVLWVGWLLGGFVGRRIVQRVDTTMHLIPVVRSVYPYSKQLIEFFFAEKKVDYDTVVAVPYPSKHLYSLAFVTSDGLRTLHEETRKTLLSVFIPSSPMPMTGYTIFVEPQNVIPLPISVDEALRITMTGGVLIPPSQLTDEKAGETIRRMLRENEIDAIPEPDPESTPRSTEVEA